MSWSTDLFRQPVGRRRRSPRGCDGRAAEVSINRGLAKQRRPEVELLDDSERAQVEELVDRRRERRFRSLSRAERVDPDRDRLDDADRVGDLNLAAPSQARGNDGLRHVPSAVGTGAVDLRRILARETAAAMTRVAAIRVDHDLATGEPGISNRTSDDESPCGIDERAEVAILELGRNHGIDHVLGDVRTQLFGGDLLVVLCGEHHRVDYRRLIAFSLADRHHDLAIWPEVVEHLGAADVSEPPRDAMREHNWQRHQLGCLVASKSEHHSGVAGAAHVNALRDVRRLLVDARDHAARLGVEAVLRARVADLSHGLPDDARDVDVAVGGDLAGHDHQAGGYHGLAGHPGQRILGQDGVEDGVGDLVGDFVRVAFGDRLGRKQAGRHLTGPPLNLPRRQGRATVWARPQAPGSYLWDGQILADGYLVSAQLHVVDARVAHKR